MRVLTLTSDRSCTGMCLLWHTCTHAALTLALCSPQALMLLPYRIIVVLGLTVALAAAWSVAPVEGPAAVDADVLKLAQGFRTPTETSVSNPEELKEALADPSIDAIVLLDGVYNLTSTLGLEIDRSVSIRANTAGKAVLDGQGKVQVLSITSGTVDLNGLQITGGYADYVRCTF